MVAAIEQKEAVPHVRVGPSLLRLMAALVLPVTVAWLLDVNLHTLPLLTLATLIICLPLASVLVVRSSLRDMDRLIAVVAPETEPVAMPVADDDPQPAASQDCSPFAPTAGP